MRVLHLSFFLLCLAGRVCNGKSVEIEGFGECTDCTQPNTNTFSGLLVSIECKDGTGYVRSEGKLDGQGKFRVSLPEELVEGGKLREDCYTQLHSTSSGTTLCPVPNLGASSSKITVLKSSTKDTHKFEIQEKLKLSRAACASHQSLFHNPDYYLKHHPIFKKKKPLPHIPIYKKPFPPIPVYKKPLPPPIPVYKKPLPPIPVYKKPLLPPPIPVYKKPFPPIPVYEKPLPPPIPVYKKPLYKPIYKKPFPPIPVYKKPPLPPLIPVYKKPHLFPLPPPISIPIYKKPCPPLPIYKKPLPSFPFPPKPFP